MCGVDIAVGIDLEGVVVERRVLEQSVVGFEQLVRKEEKVLPKEDDSSAPKAYLGRNLTVTHLETPP